MNLVSFKQNVSFLVDFFSSISILKYLLLVSMGFINQLVTGGAYCTMVWNYLMG